MDVKSIMENFKRAYPSDTIVAYKHKKGGAGKYCGHKLLEVTLNDGFNLKIFKLTKSSGAWMSSDEIKVRTFPFVYESRNVTDGKQRREFLNQKFTAMFPNHCVNLFTFNDGYWSRYSNSTKGSTYFKDGYGSEVDVVLS